MDHGPLYRMAVSCTRLRQPDGMPRQHVNVSPAAPRVPCVRFPQVDLGAFEEELSRALNSATPHLQRALAGLRGASPPPHSHPPPHQHLGSSIAQQLLWMGEGGAGAGGAAAMGAATNSVGVPGVHARRLRPAVASGPLERREDQEEDGHVADAPHAPVSWWVGCAWSGGGLGVRDGWWMPERVGEGGSTARVQEARCVRSLPLRAEGRHVARMVLLTMACGVPAHANLLNPHQHVSAVQHRLGFRLYY